MTKAQIARRLRAITIEAQSHDERTREKAVDALKELTRIIEADVQRRARPAVPFFLSIV